MAQPIVKYTLNKRGQTPEWINTSDSSFAGEHGISGNKTGCIPRYESPQDTIFLGIATGDPDSDGTPDDYVGTFANKTALQTYITATGSTLQYKTTTGTVTGIQTATTVGLATVWKNTEDYQGGLSTSTTTKHTASGVGTVATISTSGVTKVVTVVDTTTGSSIGTVSNPIVIDAASTLSGVSTSVGIGTTTGTDEFTGVTTTTTTTDTTSYTYTDVTTSSSTSTSSTTTDGVTTRTDTVVTSETTNYETSYDYATEATRLWDIYTALNS